MEAVLSGWDHVATLRALRLPGSRMEAGSQGDKFEFSRAEASSGQRFGQPS